MNRRGLLAAIIRSGSSVESLSRAIGINKSTFYKKLDENAHADFYRREMIIIRRELGLSAEEMDEIFFNDEVA